MPLKWCQETERDNGFLEIMATVVCLNQQQKEEGQKRNRLESATAQNRMSYCMIKSMFEMRK